MRVEDLRNPKRRSGYDHVRFEDVPGRAKPYAAYVGRGSYGDWHGPHRETPEEAARDYITFVQSGGVKVGKLTVDLRRAGHARKVAKGALRRKRSGRKRQAQQLGYVYCIGEENSATAVKIGYSADATLRVGTLQTGNPRKLVILGVLRGTRADERELHAEYQHDNILGEWFRPTAALLSEFEIDMEMIA